MTLFRPTPSPRLSVLPERIQSAKVPPSFVFRFFSFSYLSGVRCFLSRDLLAFSLRRFHKLARSDILEGTRKLHCVEQTGVTSNSNLLLTKFKFIDRFKDFDGSIELFQAGIYRYIVYTVLYRHLVCGRRQITYRIMKKKSNPEEMLIGGKRTCNFKLFFTSNLHLYIFFVSFSLSFIIFSKKNDNNLTYTDSVPLSENQSINFKLE